MKLRVYADESHYSEPHRRSLNDILKALWVPPNEDRTRFGTRAQMFELADADRAHIHLLPMKWQYYVDEKREDLAIASVEAARAAHRPIAIFSLNDFEANFPIAGDDIHIFQAAGYRSRTRNSNHGIPPFFPDPLPLLGGVVQLRDHADRPSVGFCGQAGAGWWRHLVRIARNRSNVVLWQLGRLRYEPPPFEHTWFRQRVIDTFAKSRIVDSTFVLRAQYRAGVASAANRNEASERSRREFIDNVVSTDFTLAVRGGGNFSVRFYEALALGRIPAFIDTDCLLPFHDEVPWKSIMPWIDANALSSGPDVVADFYARLSTAELRELQLSCRRLWEERLSPDGFYAHFHKHFPEVTA